MSSSIDNNTMDLVHEGIHMFDDQNHDTSDLSISGNIIQRNHRMAIELQVGGQTMKVNNNQVLSSYACYWYTWGISVASAPLQGIQVLNNYITTSCDGTTGPAAEALEIMGIGVTVSGNVMVGNWGSGIDVGWGTNRTLTGNYMCGGTMSVSPQGTSILYYAGQSNPATDSVSSNTFSKSCANAPAPPGT